MQRMLFILGAYPFAMKLQVLVLFAAELMGLAKHSRRYFRKDIVESRSILGFVLDHEGTAEHGDEEMIISFVFNKKRVSLLLRWKSSDFLVFNQVFILEEYKKVTGYKFESPVIIDAGANIGCTSVYLSVFYPDSKIIAIEPDKDNFNIMVRNLTLNSLSMVKPLLLAVWYINGKVSMTEKFRDERNWSLQVSESGGQDTEARTLRHILSDEGIDRVDILKMDIEGAEQIVFQKDESLESVIASVSVIAIELHGETDEVEKRLSGFGFTMEKNRETLFATTLR